MLKDVKKMLKNIIKGLELCLSYSFVKIIAVGPLQCVFLMLDVYLYMRWCHDMVVSVALWGSISPVITATIMYHLYSGPANLRPVSRSRDHSGPIRSLYLYHVMTEGQSEATIMYHLYWHTTSFCSHPALSTVAHSLEPTQDSSDVRRLSMRHLDHWSLDSAPSPTQ